MTQRSIFINGFIILVVGLFLVRMWLVNQPQVEDKPISATESLPAQNLDEGDERTLEISAAESGWKPIGRGPLIITATGKLSLGGQQTVPNDDKHPGDEKALVPALPYGTLLGRIGENGKPFKIGVKAQIGQQQTIYLAINDSNYSDNSGTYTVTVKRGYKHSADEP